MQMGDDEEGADSAAKLAEIADPPPQSLADIEAGRFVEGDSGVDASTPPAWLGPTQRACYDRTRDVFEQHAFVYTMCFHVSLVIGFNLKPLLDALVFTGDSGTPTQALQRYMDTFAHLVDWHTGDIFDPTATAYKSVEDVRKIHAGVRGAMEAKGKKLAINQFNLAVVQSGFMGLSTVAPEQLGLVLKESQLSDYVFFWRCVGRQLGIDDRFNLCGGGKRASDAIVQEVTEQMLFPAVANPPAGFDTMAQAYIDSLNSVWKGVPLLSVKSTMAVTYWALGKEDEVRPPNANAYLYAMCT